MYVCMCVYVCMYVYKYLIYNFNYAGNQKDVYNQMEEKSNQSFGATLYSTGLNGRVIVSSLTYTTS